MIFKIKKDYEKDILFIMDDGDVIDFMEGCEKNSVFTKISNKLKFHQMDSYINVLYKNKIGWINERYIEKL